MENIDNKTVNPKEDLFDRQMETLKLFLERGAISQSQYDKSSYDLALKMGFLDKLNNK